MKHLVVYSSQTGNTRKLAESLFSRLSEEKDIHQVRNAPDPRKYDVVAVGFWFNGGQPDPESMAYLQKCNTISKLFLFATHGAKTGSELAVIGMNKARELAVGSNVVGVFSCQGEVPEKVIENAKNNDPQPAWLKDAQSAKGHPDNNDLYNLNLAIEKAGLVEIPKQGEKRMFS